MFDNYALNIKERTSEYQEARKDIKELVNNLDEISLFEIYCAHPADFIGDEHYRRGIEEGYHSRISGGGRYIKFVGMSKKICGIFRT